MRDVNEVILELKNDVRELKEQNKNITELKRTYEKYNFLIEFDLCEKELITDTKGYSLVFDGATPFMLDKIAYQLYYDEDLNEVMIAKLPYANNDLELIRFPKISNDDLADIKYYSKIKKQKNDPNDYNETILEGINLFLGWLIIIGSVIVGFATGPNGFLIIIGAVPASIIFLSLAWIIKKLKKINTNERNT